MRKSTITITLETLENELLKVSGKLGPVFTQVEFHENANEKFSAWAIRRDLKTTLGKAKELFGYDRRKSGFIKGETQWGNKKDVGKKVYCARGEGGMMSVNKCYPGCNDACQTCPHPNEKNRMSHTLTKEEEDEFKYTGNIQGGYGVSQGSLA